MDMENDEVIKDSKEIYRRGYNDALKEKNRREFSLFSIIKGFFNFIFDSVIGLGKLVYFLISLIFIIFISFVILLIFKPAPFWGNFTAFLNNDITTPIQISQNKTADDVYQMINKNIENDKDTTLYDNDLTILLRDKLSLDENVFLLIENDKITYYSNLDSKETPLWIGIELTSKNNKFEVGRYKLGRFQLPEFVRNIFYNTFKTVLKFTDSQSIAENKINAISMLIDYSRIDEKVKIQSIQTNNGKMNITFTKEGNFDNANTD